MRNRNTIENDELLIENAEIRKRNFRGEETDFSPAGRRTFLLVLPEDIAERVAKDGWNVKRFKAHDDDEETPDAFVSVRVAYKKRPPMIWLITSRGRTLIGEDNVNMLDWVDILNVDVIVSPYHWEVRGNSGISVYLRYMYITIRENALDKKYAHIPDTNALPEQVEEPF